MKAIIISVFLLCISTTVSAQTYTFSSSTGTYTNLASGTPVNYLDKIPIGFTFNFFGQNYDSIQEIREGYFFFNKMFDPKVVIAAFDAGGTANGNPGRSYQLTGTTGNRILKVEWNNLIHNNNSLMYANCQVWLYEGSNCIEIHYGPNASMPSSFYSPYTGPNIGIGLPESGNYWVVTGNTASPNFIPDNGTNVNGTPVNGTIYSFCFTSGINDNSIDEMISIYPNPYTSQSVLHINAFLSNADIEIINSLGSVIKKYKGICGIDNIFESGQLPKGFYIVRVSQGGRTIAKKELEVIN